MLKDLFQLFFAKIIAKRNIKKYNFRLITTITTLRQTIATVSIIIKIPKKFSLQKNKNKKQKKFHWHLDLIWDLAALNPPPKI